MNQEEAIAKLTEVSGFLDDINNDEDGLLVKITDLTEALNNAGSGVPSALVDAINAVSAKAKTVSEKVPVIPADPNA